MTVARRLSSRPPCPVTTTSCSSKSRRITTSSPSTRMSRDRRRRLPRRQERPSPLHLAVEAAKTLKTSLAVVTVVPQPWMTPSPARIDAEYAPYADQLAADSANARRRQCIDSIADGLDVSYHKFATGRRPAGCLEAAEELERRGAGPGFGGRRHARPGGARLDHRLAAALLAGAPRDQPARLPRVESRQADPDHVRLPGHTGIAARRRTGRGAHRTARCPDAGRHLRDPGPHDVPARGRAAAPRTRCSSQLAAQCARTLAQLKTDGVVGDDVELQVVTGNGWDEALDDTDWQDGDLLALGTSPVGGIAQGVPGLARRKDHPAQPGAGAGAARASTSRCRGRRRSG